jgi:SAM-dependent methyltransferase
MSRNFGVAKMIKKIVTKFFLWLPEKVQLFVLKQRRNYFLSKSLELNLNIGAGSREIVGFKSLDFYSEKYYPSKRAFDKSRLHYDINKDLLPFNNDSVSNIYISHVLEHVADTSSSLFMREAKRVLVPGGVCRIVCPDAKFLFEVSQFKSSYWAWRKSWANNKLNSSTDYSHFEPLDFFIAEIGTQRLRFRPDQQLNVQALHPSALTGLSVEDACKKIVDGVSFSESDPSHHINWYTIKKISDLAVQAGFRNVVESKCQGSITPSMRGPGFDEKAPVMSMYVDLIK